MARRRGVLATLVQIQREAERDRERRARAAVQSQRDTERAVAAQARAAVQDQKLRDRLYAEARTQEAAEDTAQLERQVQVLQSVLAATLGVDDHLDLEALKQAPLYPAFDPLVGRSATVAPTRGATSQWRAPRSRDACSPPPNTRPGLNRAKPSTNKALDDYRVAAQRHAQQLDEARLRHEADVARQVEEHRQHVERSMRCNAIWRRVNQKPSSATSTSCSKPPIPRRFPALVAPRLRRSVRAPRHRVRVAAS